MQNHLEGLNEKQREAALYAKGPLLIIAGAGAGKTKTLAHRILHLIKTGIAPESVLAITFTNKAAKEMRDRIQSLLSLDKNLNFPVSSFPPVLKPDPPSLRESGASAGQGSLKLEPGTFPFVSTFHSLGVHILKENASAIGATRHFGIFDRGDSLRAIREAEELAGVNPKDFEPGRILSAISREKGNMVTAEEFAARAEGEYFPSIISSVWEKYEEILRREKAFDFDDLLLKTALLLQGKAAVREHYQSVWRYIHIDEYQDTNRVQYMIAKLLAEKERNICVVGDVDQNIYSFRGADIKNILEFEKDYPEAKVALLEENYRSTQTILSVANRIIEKNKMRKEKNLFTRKGAGERVGLFEAYDEGEEARFVALKSKELIEKGTKPSEVAVLYRANFQSRALEEAFLHEDTPYQVLGIRFFERKEVKDALSYIKAALNNESLSDLKRIINAPPRGLGKVALLKILSGRQSELRAGAARAYGELRNLLSEIKRLAETREKPSAIMRFAVEKSGLAKELSEGGAEGEERLENIRELATFAAKYDGLPKEEGLERFLADAALAGDQDELLRDKESVKLMTAHAAKGLEFDYVFVTGLEDGLFPHSREDDERKGGQKAEEERRLFYVALTRARKKVFLSYASVRTIFGRKQVNVPSEFVFDIDEEFLEKEERFEGGGKVIYLD